MTDFYSRMSVSVEKILRSKGQQLVLLKEQGGVFDPVQGKYTAGNTTTEHDYYGAVLPLTEYQDTRFLEELALGKLRKIIIEANSLLGTEPVPGDEIKDSQDVTYEVLSHTPVAPSGSPITYIIYAKRVSG